MSNLTLKDREKLIAEYASLGIEMEMDELQSLSVKSITKKVE